MQLMSFLPNPPLGKDQKWKIFRVLWVFERPSSRVAWMQSVWTHTPTLELVGKGDSEPLGFWKLSTLPGPTFAWGRVPLYSPPAPSLPAWYPTFPALPPLPHWHFNKKIHVYGSFHFSILQVGEKRVLERLVYLFEYLSRKLSAELWIQNLNYFHLVGRYTKGTTKWFSDQTYHLCFVRDKVLEVELLFCFSR